MPKQQCALQKKYIYTYIQTAGSMIPIIDLRYDY